MKNYFLVVTLAVLVSACGGESQPKTEVKAESNAQTQTKQEAPVKEKKVEEYDVMKDLGIGPITSVFLGFPDEKLAATGKETFKAKCSACHKIEKKFVGPALQGILDRRTPEWVMNMILNPEEMMEKNPTAKALYAEFLSPMANQNLTEEEARAILEYLRTN